MKGSEPLGSLRGFVKEREEAKGRWRMRVKRVKKVGRRAVRRILMGDDGERRGKDGRGNVPGGCISTAV